MRVQSGNFAGRLHHTISFELPSKLHCVVPAGEPRRMPDYDLNRTKCRCTTSPLRIFRWQIDFLSVVVLILTYELSPILGDGLMAQAAAMG